jgi:hypothetical protein
MPRRGRLMAAAALRIQSHPLARQAARGVPLGDGHGLEDVVSVVRPLFTKERSLTRWVAIRGALLFLDMAAPDETSWDRILNAMGLCVTQDPVTHQQRTELLPSAGPLTPEVQGNIVGVFGSLARHLEDYGRVSKMSIDDVNSDPTWRVVNEAVALDYIAWASVALCRTNELEAVHRTPEAGVLESPGWYADPLWAKAERFWNGTDWTQRMRVRDGRRWVEVSQAMQ